MCEIMQPARAWSRVWETSQTKREKKSGETLTRLGEFVHSERGKHIRETCHFAREKLPLHGR